MNIDLGEIIFIYQYHKKTFDSLNKSGIMMVNILGPKVKGKRYRSGDELVDMLKPYFMGQVGMRMTATHLHKENLFQDEDGNFDKDAMNDFMSKIYIENVWCFGKDKSKDLFKDIKRGTLGFSMSLEQFFTRENIIEPYQFPKLVIEKYDGFYVIKMIY